MSFIARFGSTVSGTKTEDYGGDDRTFIAGTLNMGAAFQASERVGKGWMTLAMELDMRNECHRRIYGRSSARA
jgi:hypothetical protein